MFYNSSFNIFFIFIAFTYPKHSQSVEKNDYIMAEKLSLSTFFWFLFINICCQKEPWKSKLSWPITVFWWQLSDGNQKTNFTRTLQNWSGQQWMGSSHCFQEPRLESLTKSKWKTDINFKLTHFSFLQLSKTYFYHETVVFYLFFRSYMLV